MTQGQFSSSTSTSSAPDNLLDDDGDLSPSDGYFGGNPTVPNTMLIPDPSSPQSDPQPKSKAEEAAQNAHVSGSSSPFESRYAAYTPATTRTPASSSAGDSGSAYHGSARRYRDSEDTVSERSPLLEEPPPMYDDAMAESRAATTSNEPFSPVSGQANGYNTIDVREPVPSVRSPPFGGSRVSESMVGRGPEMIAVDDSTGKPDDEESGPALAFRRSRRGCCGRRRTQRKERGRFKRVFFLMLVGVLLLVWLILHLVQWRRSAHGRHRTTNPPSSTDPFPSRSIRQHETSRSITGSYPLYDLLDLSTYSGSISITVVPKPGTEPAVLRLSTKSGSINIRVDPTYLRTSDPLQLANAGLNRTFETHMSTISGSVTGSIMHGSGSAGGGSTTISVRSGAINMEIHPMDYNYYDKADGASMYNAPTIPDSLLNTQSYSGSTHVSIQAPAWGSMHKIRNLVANHRILGSGSMTLQYPTAWEGGLHAQTLGSGTVNVHGQNLEFERLGSREVYGWRGEADERGERKVVEAQIVGSGSLTFIC